MLSLPRTQVQSLVGELRSHKSKKEFGLFLKSEGERYGSVNTCALVSSVCNLQPFIKARRWRDSTHKAVWTSTRAIELRMRALPPSCCGCATWSKFIKPLGAAASSVLLLLCCPTLCDPMDCSIPGLPVVHCLLEFAQVHVHWVGDAIQPSHPMPPSSPFCLQSFLASGSFPMSWLLASSLLCEIRTVISS